MTNDAAATSLFRPAEWCGEWESFEHYITSDEAEVIEAWQASEQAVLANPKTAPMAAHGGLKAFWAAACKTTSSESIIPIGYWRISDPIGASIGASIDASADTTANDDATDIDSAPGFTLEWFAEDDTSLDTYRYRLDHVMEHGLEGAPTFVFVTDDSHAADSPFRWLLAIAPMPARADFVRGALIAHLHFQYANALESLVSHDSATGVETLVNPRWYATMCACDGEAADRARVVRALHHLDA